MSRLASRRRIFKNTPVSDMGVDNALDSFAVLAYLGDEPVPTRAQTVLKQAEKGQFRAVLSLIKLDEVAYSGSDLKPQQLAVGRFTLKQG